MSSSLLQLDPVPTLLRRLREELSADFPSDQPIRIARAPGRLDVMGGIADYTGSMVCEMPLDRAAAVAVSTRADRQVQVFSFNLLDEHKPFTLRIPLDALAKSSLEDLRREFNEPGRHWAAYMVGCLAILHRRGAIDLADPSVAGVNLALLSTVPLGAGISSSAAVEVATMMALRDHLLAPENAARLLPIEIADLCQRVENLVVGAPCGIMDQVASCRGEADRLLLMVCQERELAHSLRTMPVPAGVRFVGINSNVRHSVAGGQYGRTRCAAFMAHRIILETMRRIGAAARRELAGDPMRGYLANLDPDDYKQIFRPALPESMKGGEFLLKYGSTIDKVTTVEPDYHYRLIHAADHHVLEARRVRYFVGFLEEASSLPAGTSERRLLLDKAGHLMYASHLSYSNDAMLGAPECDLLVDLIRQRERQGFYGAKITGGGQGGTVAVLADMGSRADEAIAQVMAEYERQTGRRADLFAASSPGAWHVGTTLLAL